ncbi:hypothetical protein HWV62_43736 [Athelia sp. TMB]|nr:hypothetical protein HWV62_43736 [Athelia sp. TMB]
MSTYSNSDSEYDTSSEGEVPQARWANPVNFVSSVIASAQAFRRAISPAPVPSPTPSRPNPTLRRLKTEVERKTIDLIRHRNRSIKSSPLASLYPYVRNVDARAGTSARPAVGEVFDHLLSSQNKKRMDHPNGMSGLVHASLTIIALSLFRSNISDDRYNENSPYLDLSPLYGVNDDEANSIRIKDGRGMLAPDCFSESRILFLHPATAALLILWNRNHNYYAKHLLFNNEGEKWRDPGSSSVASSLSLTFQDDQIFETARKINCAIFRKFVAEDLIKELTGRSNVDEGTGLNFLKGSDGVRKDYQSSVESSLLYHWSGLLTKAGEERIKRDMINISDCRDATEASRPTHPSALITIEEFQENLERVALETNTNRQWRHLGLRRGEDGRVDDTDIARVLQGATESEACPAGARSIPSCMRVIEMMVMRQARSWKVCSLNDFRSFLGLKPYVSFDEWSSSSEVAAAARTIYGDIANLELYAEDATSFGFCMGSTMTYGLLVDLITRIRSDAEVASMNEIELTQWGYSQLLIRHLSRNYPYDNVYSLFPFRIPTKAKEIVGSLPIDKQELYDHHKPHIGAAVSLDAAGDIRAVFEDSTGAYSTSYERDLRFVTQGTGFLLGFDDKPSHDTDKLMILYTFTPNCGTLSKHAKTIRCLTDRFISECSSGPDGVKVDIVGEVINRTCARWVCDTINYRKEDGWTVRLKAMESAEKLSKQIENSLKVSAHPKEERLAKAIESRQYEATFEDPDRSGQDLEIQRIVANVLGLSIMSCTSFARVCSHAVDFYLRDEQASKRALITELSKRNNPYDNAEIMGYIREAQRIEQSPNLIRIANRDAQISQKLCVKEGDCVVADFKKIHMNPAEVPSPEIIDIKRQTPSIQGLGSHKCLGVSFVNETMPENPTRSIECDEGASYVIKRLIVQYDDKFVVQRAGSVYGPYILNSGPITLTPNPPSFTGP